MLTRSSARAALLLSLALFAAACSTVPRRGDMSGAPVRRGPVSDTPVKIGKPYQVAGLWYYPADDRAYDEVGYASWYGDAFHGGPTANGERFDMDMVGAAHKTLPLPSYVEVTALDTGRTILVRVNDRGPFVATRIIDLSRRSAQLLGIDRKGVARVRVRRVEPPEADRMALRSGRPASARPDAPRELLAQLDARFRLAMQPRPVQVAAVTPVAAPVVAPAPTTTLNPALIGGWFVQVGAFGDRARADSVAAGLGASIESDGTLHRVRTGPYFDEPSALAALALAQGRGYQDARLIRPRAGN